MVFGYDGVIVYHTAESKKHAPIVTPSLLRMESIAAMSGPPMILAIVSMTEKMAKRSAFDACLTSEDASASSEGSKPSPIPQSNKATGSVSVCFRGGCD